MHDSHLDVPKGGLKVTRNFPRAHLREYLLDALNALLYRLLLILSLLATILQEIVDHLVESHCLSIDWQPICKVLKSGPEHVLRLSLQAVASFSSVPNVSTDLPHPSTVIGLQSCGHWRLGSSSKSNFAPAYGAVLAPILNKLNRAMLVEMVSTGWESSSCDHLLLAYSAIIEFINNLD